MLPLIDSCPSIPLFCFTVRELEFCWFKNVVNIGYIVLKNLTFLDYSFRKCYVQITYHLVKSNTIPAIAFFMSLVILSE